MRGVSWFVDILRDRSKLLRLKLTNLFPNINFSGEKDSGKVLIIIIILFLIIIIKEGRKEGLGRKNFNYVSKLCRRFWKGKSENIFPSKKKTTS